MGEEGIAYADVENDRMSTATSFYATFQQLTLSLGICTAATVLGVGILLSGREHPSLGSFSVAFLVVAAISASAVICNRSLASDADVEMSDHRGAPS